MLYLRYRGKDCNKARYNALCFETYSHQCQGNLNIVCLSSNPAKQNVSDTRSCIEVGGFDCTGQSCLVEEIQDIGDPRTCQIRCAGNYACWHFSYNPATGLCTLMDKNALEHKVEDTGLYRGPWDCEGDSNDLDNKVL